MSVGLGLGSKLGTGLGPLEGCSVSDGASVGSDVGSGHNESEDRPAKTMFRLESLVVPAEISSTEKVMLNVLLSRKTNSTLRLY